MRRLSTIAGLLLLALVASLLPAVGRSWPARPRRWW